MSQPAEPPGALQALRTAFARDGYVVVDDVDVLEGLDAESIWQQFAATYAAGGDRVQDAWQTSSAVRAIAVHPAVLALLRALYGREPIPFQTLNYLRGTQQRTHSDTLHFSCLPGGFMCGVWVALEDVSLAQGPLHYYPGSHTLPELDYEDLGIPVPGPPFTFANPHVRKTYLRYEDRIAELVAGERFPRRELAIPRGRFLVWSANLLHGGSPIADPDSTRKSQVTHYYFDGVVPYTPMFSRRSEGRFRIRRIQNVVDGRYPIPTLDGTRVLFERTPAGLRRIRLVASALDRAVWSLMRYRPLPDTPGSIARTLLGDALARRG